jgi:hypothetical protein
MIAKSSRRERPYERHLRHQAEFLDQMRAKIKAADATSGYNATVHVFDLQKLVWAFERDAKR